MGSFAQDGGMPRTAQPAARSPANVFIDSTGIAAYANGAIPPVMAGPRG